jgi:dienelactone hydrolase
VSALQCAEHLRRRFDGTTRSHRFSGRTESDWRFWRQGLRGRLRDLLGLDRMLRSDLNPRLTETVACEGYTRERVEIDVEPGVSMPLYVLVPLGLKGTAPPVIAPHGHISGGKYAVAGRRELSSELGATIDQHNYDYGVQAVRKGYVVFCPDARGFGERRERFAAAPDQLLENSCHVLAHMALPLGLTVAGMWTWDLMALVGYALTRPETAGEKLGCIGLSGGGLQTMYLAALDERVSCAVVSGYFYGVADSLLHMADNCDCNYVPHLWETADMGDVAALIAPRPLLIETATEDPLNGPRGMANVLEQYEITDRTYRLLGASDRLRHDTFPGGHHWNGAAAFDWLDQWLRR